MKKNWIILIYAALLAMTGFISDTSAAEDRAPGNPQNKVIGIGNVELSQDAEAAELVKPVMRVRVILPQPSSEVSRNIVKVFERQVADRCDARVVTAGDAPLVVELVIDGSIGNEGFCIKNRQGGGIAISGSNELGLLYGLGKLLRTSGYSQKGFAPGSWRGESVPQKPIRGIYFATHFHNYYHDAPVEEIERYVEELGLWGFNTLVVWYDMHHFDGADDPEAVKFRKKLYAICQAARNIGMDVGFINIANEAYNNSPRELRVGKDVGRGGWYDCAVCPATPEGMEYVLKVLGEEYDWCAGLEPKYVVIWPYDQGGCGCTNCRPWGSNGFLKTGAKIAELARKKLPGVKIIASTWYLNRDEWAGMAKALKGKYSWADTVLAEGHVWKLDGLPMVGFPEISMHGMFPWGGFGASILAVRVEKQWNRVKAASAGGFPYSEGIFEDVSKVVYSQLFWSNRTRAETLKEYIAYEYSPEHVDALHKVMVTLEENHHFRWWPGQMEGASIPERWIPHRGTKPQADPGAEEVWATVQQVDKDLPQWARSSWRWRILYLRALLDAELKANGGQPNARCNQAFEELIRIYHAEKANPVLRPPYRTRSEGGNDISEKTRDSVIDIGNAELGVVLGDNPGPAEKRVTELLAERIKDRTGITLADSGRKAALGLVIGTVASNDRIKTFSATRKDIASLGPDGYVIAITPGKPELYVVGQNDGGVVAGVGRLMREIRYQRGRIELPALRISEAPQMPNRGMYLWARQDFFGKPDQVDRYIEEFSLWGCNALAFWFEMGMFNSFDDPDAQHWLAMYRRFYETARRMGMKTGLIMVVNDAYKTSPEKLRISPIIGCPNHYLCPNKPGSVEQMIAWQEQVFKALPTIDIFNLFPADPGGCSCPDCTPWPTRGFWRIAKPLADRIHEISPGTAIWVDTWHLNHKTFGDKDWKNLVANLDWSKERPEWFAGFEVGLAPRHGFAAMSAEDRKYYNEAKQPLMVFPDISMWGNHAGMLVNKEYWKLLQAELNDYSPELMKGGWPYSERWNTDIASVMFLSWFWNSKKAVETVLDEYASFYFGSGAAAGRELLDLLDDGNKDPKRKEKIRETLAKLEGSLPGWVKRDWRWAEIAESCRLSMVPPNKDWKSMMTIADRKHDAQGYLLPLQSYDKTIRRGMDFLLKDHLKWFKGPPETLLDEKGNTQMPWVYYSNLQHDGTPFPDSVDRFVSYPAFHHALMIRTFIGYWRYAKDARALEEAVTLADWSIAHSTPGDWACASLPYSTFEAKKAGGFRDKTGLMPDKAAIMALAYLQLHEATREARFLRAAEAIATTLSKRQRANGTWPFRVDPKTEAVIEDYSSSVIYPVMLFESLDRRKGNHHYQANRDLAWKWLLNGPIKNKDFRGFYEDIPDNPSNRTNYDCLDTIRYLLANRTDTNGYLELAKELNAWIEKMFLDKIRGFEPAEGIREQLACNVVMGIHSLNWASMLLELSRATGDEKMRQRAMQTANYITYYLQPDNRIVVGFTYPQWWYSCHAGPVLYLLDFVTLETRSTSPAGSVLKGTGDTNHWDCVNAHNPHICHRSFHLFLKPINHMKLSLPLVALAGLTPNANSEII